MKEMQFQQNMDAIKPNLSCNNSCPTPIQMRGAGDACGTRQSGDAGFQLLDIAKDAHLVNHWYQHFPDFETDDLMIKFWRPLAESID